MQTHTIRRQKMNITTKGDNTPMIARTIANSPMIGASIAIDTRKESTKTSSPFIAVQTR